mgnify:CR=1 FL=1
MKEKAAITIIVLSLLLLLGNVLNLLFGEGEADVGFWARIVSAVMLLLAMSISLHAWRKEKQ